jgi:hypothetical protein
VGQRPQVRPLPARINPMADQPGNVSENDSGPRNHAYHCVPAQKDLNWKSDQFDPQGSDLRLKNERRCCYPRQQMEKDGQGRQSQGVQGIHQARHRKRL